jgi:hypothetical protein
MTKQALLKKVYEIIGGKDMIEQDELYAAQEILENEIVMEAAQGNLQIKRYSNGYIHKINL